jgi:hypothetical protein
LLSPAAQCLAEQSCAPPCGAVDGNMVHPKAGEASSNHLIAPHGTDTAAVAAVAAGGGCRRTPSYWPASLQAASCSLYCTSSTSKGRWHPWCIAWWLIVLHHMGSWCSKQGVGRRRMACLGHTHPGNTPGAASAASRPLAAVGCKGPTWRSNHGNRCSAQRAWPTGAVRDRSVRGDGSAQHCCTANMCV